jgi:hypothetical protein
MREAALVGKPLNDILLYPFSGYMAGKLVARWRSMVIGSSRGSVISYRCVDHLPVDRVPQVMRPFVDRYDLSINQRMAGLDPSVISVQLRYK